MVVTEHGNLEGAVIDLDTLANGQILFWKPSDMIKFDLRLLIKLGKSIFDHPWQEELIDTNIPIEAISMEWLIRYLKRIEQMGVGRWPNVIFNEGMSERKKTWMSQNYTWMQEWNIYLNVCPTNSKELKNFVMEKFYKRVWGKSWVERRSDTLRNSTRCVISNKKSTLELTFCGGRRFLLLN